MDDELDQLEAELGRLRPAAPARDLIARIERDLAPRAIPRPRPRVHWLWAAAFPAAAAVALAIWRYSPGLGDRDRPAQDGAAVTALASTQAGPATGPALLKPVRAENVLVSASDEGLVTLADGTPARRERLHYVDTITWKNSRTNASLTWSLPREEVRVVPIIFQ